jgi:hypothetical protein
VPKSYTRVAPIRRILRVADDDVMIQLVRLVVLYEDLKVEFFGLDASDEKMGNDVSRHYGHLYIIRRAFATIWEMENAIHKLNMLKQFKADKRTWDRPRLRTWTGAVRFFGRTKDFIDRQRNAYGGHFSDSAARFVLDRIRDTDNSVGSLEVKFTDERSYRLVFKFAESIVSQALFIDRPGKDDDGLETYFHDSVEILTSAVRHATHATQILGDIYFMPVFGWNRRR